MDDSAAVTRLTLDLSTASVAATAFHCWDTLLTMDREVQYIWSKPNSSWLKWAFLFSRYFPLLIQIIGRAVDLSILYQHPLRFSRNFIRVWYTSQVLAAWLTILGAEIVMMSRVYAMYHKNRWVGIGFVVLVILESAVVFVGLGLTLPGSSFEGAVLITTTSESFVWFGASAMVTQIIILVLSIVRYVRGNWGGIPIITLMMRDGTIAFGVLFVISFLLVVYTTLHLDFAATTYAWMLTFISVTECRLILNMQRVPVLGSSLSRTSEAAPLTTFLTEQYNLTDFTTVDDTDVRGDNSA